MKKYLYLFFVAIFATLSFTLTSCGDDDEPADVDNTEIDYDLESSGSITVKDGSKTYTRKIKNAGYALYKTDISDKLATLRFRAYFESEGSPYETNYIDLNNNRIKEILFYSEVEKVSDGEIAKFGSTVIHYFYKDGRDWMMSQKNGDFNGKVEIIKYEKNKYITVKFTDCTIKVSGNSLGQFNGEIKFAIRTPSFTFD